MPGVGARLMHHATQYKRLTLYFICHHTCDLTSLQTYACRTGFSGKCWLAFKRFAAAKLPFSAVTVFEMWQ